jgi:hypothetical protein
MATVYTAMQKCLDMTMAAGQSNSIQTFDQQLYAIGQRVKWSMLASSHAFYDWEDSIHCHARSQLLANFGLRLDYANYLSIRVLMQDALLIKS